MHKGSADGISGYDQGVFCEFAGYTSATHLLTTQSRRQCITILLILDGKIYFVYDQSRQKLIWHSVEPGPYQHSSQYYHRYIWCVDSARACKTSVAYRTLDVGSFFGAILAFDLGERLGRKKTILLGTSIMVVGAIL